MESNSHSYHSASRETVENAVENVGEGSWSVRLSITMSALGYSADVLPDRYAPQDFADPAERGFRVSLWPWPALDPSQRSNRQHLRFRLKYAPLQGLHLPRVAVPLSTDGVSLMQSGSPRTACRQGWPRG